MSTEQNNETMQKVLPGLEEAVSSCRWVSGSGELACSQAEKYAARKERERLRQASQSAAGRDIAPIPEVVDAERRERCRLDLAEFCTTYNPAAFPLKWSAAHRRALTKIEQSVLHGMLFGLAMSRGSGKSTILKMAALWATLYGHRRYVVVVGCNQAKATDIMSDLKMFVQFLPGLYEDFPEVVYPIRALGNITNRSAGQICDGRPTGIKWKQDEIVFPSIEGSAASGTRIGTTGLTGKGIRGTAKALQSGEVLRPDLVLLDDPQDDASAASATQNARNIRLICGAVLGMAGPGKDIAGVMATTVICRGDMADVVLDPTQHPEWRGERTSMLDSMPTNLGAWDRYYGVYENCLQKDPPDMQPANDYYLAHRDELDAGSVASWPERHLESEVSAVQHAMNLRFRDEAAFWAEYQNQPRGAESDEEITGKAALVERTNRVARQQVPAGLPILTAHIDVHDDLLFFAVGAFADNFTGAVVDYGTYPEQTRGMFTLRSAGVTIAAKHQGGKDGRLLAALETLLDDLTGREYKLVGGGAIKIARVLCDAGYKPAIVRGLAGKYPALMPSRGLGITAGRKPMAEFQPRPGERHGHNWLVTAAAEGNAPEVRFDANFWKTEVHQAFQTPPGDPGALTLFGDGHTDHRLYAAHLCESEYFVKTEGNGRQLREWKQTPQRNDNHWFDNTVGLLVAASLEGATLPGQRRQEKAAEPVSFAELQRQRQREQQSRQQWG